ncbi:3-dehydroquinate synthase, partial [candidate division GN15 bacterium]|nr:3-dehydroquinate synthase [candidate division GN15 bacterium]
YPVVIGPDSSATLARLVERHAPDARVFAIYDAQLYALHGPRLRQLFGLPAKRIHELVIPNGERSKSAGTVRDIQDFLLSEEIARTDLVLAVGGGVTSDTVGFAAATLYRGVRWAIVSTTLLGMVDAAIGGKTGINHPRGKNLIGAFWQPSFVLCDTGLLHTLPDRQIIAGLGEVVKSAALVGPRMIARLARYVDHGDLLDERRLGVLITESVRYKADIVKRDETERGRRMVLNLGHTFAHGIEQALGYGKLLHGEAVLIGLLAACDLSLRMGARNPRRMEEFCSVVAQFVRHIPYRQIDMDQVWEAMSYDKKRRGTRKQYILLSALGKPYVTDQVTPSQARAALKSALTQYAESRGRHAARVGS